MRSSQPVSCLLLGLLIVGCADMPDVDMEGPTPDAGDPSLPDPPMPDAATPDPPPDGGTSFVDAGPVPGAPDAGPCTDHCPARDGVSWQCRTRFMFGTNYAWRRFGGDFGGISAWGFAGVAESRDQIDAELAEMKSGGASVIRWWMFPRFWTEAITFDDEGTPNGIRGSLMADLEAALELAEANDVYIMLTPFSFDSFHPTETVDGIHTPGLQPIVADPARSAQMLEMLIRPIARVVEASPHSHRMIAWDMINEPEWAMHGPNMYGGDDFRPDSNLETVTHVEMERFLAEMAAVLRSESSALVSVGGAAIQWGTAWTNLDIDFYMLHYYDWVHEWFPYTTVTLESVGLTDKPVVMGEFPHSGVSAVGGNPARTAAELSEDLWAHGYGGALSWAFSSSSSFSSALRPFADAHPCETAY